MSRKDTIGAFFRKAQERISTTTTCWLNPEASVGLYIGKAGRESVWEAIGPARDVFNRIAPSIKAILESAVEPISSRVIWSMYMIGKAPISAAPSIIFCCEVLEHRREVRNTIKKSGILSAYPGIKTGHMPRPPDFSQLVPLAEGDLLQDDCSNLFVLSTQHRSACGLQLVVTEDGEDPRTCSARATIGGVIQLGDDYYYTTAAHALNSDTGLLAESGTFRGEEDYVVDDDAFSWDGSDTTDSATTCPLVHHDTSDTDAGLGISIALQDSSTTDSQWDGIYSAKQEAQVLTPAVHKDPIQRYISFSEQGLESLNVQSAPRISGISPKPIDRPCITSMDSQDQAAGLDYALIRVSSADHSLNNVIKVGFDDQAIVRVQRIVESEPQQENVEVIAATSRGFLKGHISGTPSYSSAPGHRSYNKMFKASLDGPLQRGDCGTWVIDPKRGDLYGHIIAGSPGEGVALIAPFTDIFEDIHNKLGQPPCLPTASGDTIDRTASDNLLETKVQGEGVIEMPRFEGSSVKSVANDVASEISGINTSTFASYDDKRIRSYSSEAFGYAKPSYENSRRARFRSVREQLGRSMQKILSQLTSINERSGLQDTKEGEKKNHQEIVNAKGKNCSTSPNPVSPRPSYDSLPSFSLTLTESLLGDSTAYKFYALLSRLSKTPIKWESPGLSNEALHDINLGSVYIEAEKIAKADSMDFGRRHDWGYEDYMIRALAIYFKRKFFTWVDNPPCEVCKLPSTTNKRMTDPTPLERARGAKVVELYRCSNAKCLAEARFPRYSDVRILLQTRRGRAGEWANCFGMLCRALGSRTRWVWNAEDHVWTEVYSEHQKRWVHVDVCEGAWDKPTLYTEEWGKKMSYCIAFSIDGATDVTRRYVRCQDCALPRTKCPEEVLLNIMREITTQRRMNMSKEERCRLDDEEAAEARELESYVAESLTPDASRLTTGGPSSGGSSSKAAEQRGFSKPDNVKRRNDASSSTYSLAWTGGHAPLPHVDPYTSVDPADMMGHSPLVSDDPDASTPGKSKAQVSPTPHASSGSDVQKKKAPRACIRCRERKVWCDAPAMTGCSRCFRTNSVCCFSGEATPRPIFGSSDPIMAAAEKTASADDSTLRDSVAKTRSNGD